MAVSKKPKPSALVDIAKAEAASKPKRKNVSIASGSDKKAPRSAPTKPRSKTYTPGTGGGVVTDRMAKQAKINKMLEKRPRSEASKQLGLLTQPLSARKTAEAKAKIQAIKGRRAAAATPSGRGASGAATKKTKPGTVTRGKSNFVLDNLRRAAGRG